MASGPGNPLGASDFASATASEDCDPASSACSPCAVILGARGPSVQPWSPGEEGKIVQKQPLLPSRPPALVRCHSPEPLAQEHRNPG